MITRIVTVCVILSLWLWICLAMFSPAGDQEPIIQEHGSTKWI